MSRVSLLPTGTPGYPSDLHRPLSWLSVSHLFPIHPDMEIIPGSCNRKFEREYWTPKWSNFFCVFFPSWINVLRQQLILKMTPVVVTRHNLKTTHSTPCLPDIGFVGMSLPFKIGLVSPVPCWPQVCWKCSPDFYLQPRRWYYFLHTALLFPFWYISLCHKRLWITS